MAANVLRPKLQTSSEELKLILEIEQQNYTKGGKTKTVK